MMIARGTIGEGADKRELLILGLSPKNIARVTVGQPLHIRREIHGEGIPEGWEIVIFTGDSEDEMRKALDPLMGPSTKINRDPRLGTSDAT